MKQGPSKSTSSGFKREPIPRAVNIPAVRQLGNTVAHKPNKFYAGMGYKSSTVPTLGKGQGPGANRTVHPHGSQRGK